MLTDLAIRFFLTIAKKEGGEGDITEARASVAHAAQAYIFSRHGRLVSTEEILKGLDRIHSS